MAVWAQTETVLAADLLAGDQDPRSSVVDLLGRPLAALPEQARDGKPRLCADAGFAGDLALAARLEAVAFAIARNAWPRCGGCFPASPTAPSSMRST